MLRKWEKVSRKGAEVAKKVNVQRTFLLDSL